MVWHTGVIHSFDAHRENIIKYSFSIGIFIVYAHKQQVTNRHVSLRTLLLKQNLTLRCNKRPFKLPFDFVIGTP